MAHNDKSGLFTLIDLDHQSLSAAPFIYGGTQVGAVKAALTFASKFAKA
jgi:hypothetical protein